MSAPDFELPFVDLPFEVPSLDARSHGDGVAVDGGILIYPAAGADEHPTYIPPELLEADRELASAILNLVPMIGQVKGVIEGIKGEDLISGRHLAWWERALDLASAIPEPPEEAPHFLKELHEISHNIHKVNEVIHSAHGVHAVYEANEAMEHQEHLEMGEEGKGGHGEAGEATTH